MTQADFTKLSMFSLEHRLIRAVDKVEMETPTDDDEKTAHEQKIADAEKVLDDLDREMVRREAEAERKLKKKRMAEREARETKFNTSSSSMTNGISNTEMNMKLKTISEACLGIEKFGPGSETSTFIRKINSMKMLAKCDQSKAYMLGMLFTRLSDEYQFAYAKHVETHPCETIEQFVAYINKQYESRRSIYQLMEELDGVGLREGESMRDLGARLQENAFEINTAVTAKFVELKKKKDVNFEGDMTKDDVFALWAGMAMLKALQPDKGLYTHTITRADDCFSALDLANVAEAYMERSQEDTMTLLHTKGQSGSDSQGRRGDSRRRGPIGVCWQVHFDGKCKRGDACRFCNKDGGKSANADPSKPSSPIHEFKNDEAQSHHIRGAQVYGAGFR